MSATVATRTHGTCAATGCDKSRRGQSSSAGRWVTINGQVYSSDRQTFVVHSWAESCPTHADVVSGEIRRWRLHLRTGLTLGELARQINPVVRGWLQYYGAFYRSVLQPLLARNNSYLMRRIRKKYRRLRPFQKAKACWQRITRQYPRLFVHWAWNAAFW